MTPSHQLFHTQDYSDRTITAERELDRAERELDRRQAELDRIQRINNQLSDELEVKCALVKEHALAHYRH